MTDRLTDEQLRDFRLGRPTVGRTALIRQLASELLALRPRVEQLEAARELFQEKLATIADDDRCIALTAAALAQARAEGKAEERERIAKWFEAKWIEESGPDWGLSSVEERKDTRYHNRRVMAYAAAIREAKP